MLVLLFFFFWFVDESSGLLIGIPSCNIVKAMAFLVKDRSDVNEGNRGTS